MNRTTKSTERPFETQKCVEPRALRYDCPMIRQISKQPVRQARLLANLALGVIEGPPFLGVTPGKRRQWARLASRIGHIAGQ